MMPNTRDQIRLNKAEQDELLDSVTTLQIASILPDGRPHLVPMWFARDDNGLLVFSTYARSQKIKNLERDARITALAETGDTYDQVRGLSIEGVAEIIRDASITMRTMQLVGARTNRQPRPDINPDHESEPPPIAYKRVTVRIKPERIRSWDHRKLA
tara:strand:+ start:243 stop:713 length:471 start_codon:yes stop_codon:yes gene_type:complete